MKNDGKAAEKAFVDYWSKVGHIERLRDRRDLIGINGGKMVADFSKPSDFMVSSRNVPLHFAEVKSTNDANRFAFKDIRPAQHKAAMLSASRGDKGYTFYIFSYKHGKWYIMNCVLYAFMVESNQKSVKFEELSEWHR